MLRSIKAFDVFQKSAPDVVPTQSAARGVFSALSLVLLGGLLVMETVAFLTQDLTRHIQVEPYAEHKLRLDLNMSLYHVPCDAVHVDYEDSMGSHYNSYSLSTISLDGEGKVVDSTRIATLRSAERSTFSRTSCGSCYGAELTVSQCCDTCDEVFDAYARRGWNPPQMHEVSQCRRKLQSVSEGCQVYGHLMLKEVPGAVHITFPSKVLDLAHTIHHLQARDYDRPDAEAVTISTAPLDGTSLYGGTHYLYVLKLTRAVLPSGLRFFEMSAHKRAVQKEHAPTLYFKYDIEPITTLYAQKQTFAQFLVSLCGIVGGVVAASRLVAVFLG